MSLWSYSLAGLCFVVCINAQAASGEEKTTCQAGKICPTTGSSMLQATILHEKSELDRQKADENGGELDQIEEIEKHVETDEGPRVSGPCVDTDDRCGTKWKDRCDDAKVIWRCRKSCNLCDKCMDWGKNCQTKWKDKCSQKNAQAICPLTCGVCSIATPVTTPGPTPVPTMYPTPEPTPVPTMYPTPEPTPVPTMYPTPGASPVTTPAPVPVVPCASLYLPYSGGYKYCENYKNAPVTKQPSVNACKKQCNDCYAVTYYWGRDNMDFWQNCYVYKTEAECGSLISKKGNGASSYLCRADEI